MLAIVHGDNSNMYKRKPRNTLAGDDVQWEATSFPLPFPLIIDTASIVKKIVQGKLNEDDPLVYPVVPK